MLKKQASNGSSDSDDNSTYDYGSGRRLNNSSNVASTSSEHNQPYKSGIEGPMILKPSNPDYSDILLQVIYPDLSNIILGNRQNLGTTTERSCNGS
jgi:hypothetical protein